MSFNNLSLSLLFISSLFFSYVNSLTFNISSFDQGSTSLIEQQGDAFIKDGKIRLTENTVGLPKANSTGRAIYKQEIVLWDEKTRELTDFTTHFSFIIKCLKSSFCGDGMTFFLAKHSETIPEGSGGGRLALYGSKTDFNNTENGFVAVEFDSFKNLFDPSADHLGIDIDSVVSVANVSLNSSIKDGRTGNAWVTYNSSTHNLLVFLTYVKDPIYKAKPTLSYNVDLRNVLPSRVAVGFSASTGLAAETHEIISWSFSSRLEGKTEDPNRHTVAESPKMAVSPVKTPVKAEAPEKPKSPEAAKSPQMSESPKMAVSPVKTAVKAEAPEKPKSPEAAKSPQMSESPVNGDKVENSANTNKSNVGLIVGLVGSIGAILFL